jgi:G3E family GTPase
MQTATDTRLRLTVLGGFLGSGKTTWLRHQLHRGAYADACVIVNEAAETPVDDALLGRAAELHVLAGGCACCTGKAEMVALLRSLCDERTKQTKPKLHRIVLETSGLADPGAIAAAIRGDAMLIHHIVVSEIIVAVDAPHGLSQFAGEPLSRRQAEIADRLIVTKLDETQDPARLLATLRRLNPGATLAGAVKGSETPLPDFSEAEPLTLDSNAEAPPPIFPTRVKIGDGIDWTAFTVWLSALLHAHGDDVVRVKGVMRTPAGRLLLQSVRQTVQQPEILPDQPEGAARDDGTIVLIGRGYRPQDLQRSLNSFAGKR